MQACGLWRMDAKPRLKLQYRNDKHSPGATMTTVSTPVANPDTQAFKTAVREQWDRSAQGWNAHTSEIRAWLRRH